jgi:hypothetical protein
MKKIVLLPGTEHVALGTHKIIAKIPSWKTTFLHTKGRN